MHTRRKIQNIQLPGNDYTRGTSTVAPAPAPMSVLELHPATSSCTQQFQGELAQHMQSITPKANTHSSSIIVVGSSQYPRYVFTGMHALGSSLTVNNSHQEPHTKNARRTGESTQ